MEEANDKGGLKRSESQELLLEAEKDIGGLCDSIGEDDDPPQEEDEESHNVSSAITVY